MQNVIRLGDSTSHGGKVVKISATHYSVEGIAIARVGDLCSCPIKGHDGCTISEGNPNHTVEGIPVAYEGHKTTCGAALIATQTVFSTG